MREVTTEGLRLLNQGAEGVVYQYSQDKVLKIYFHKTEEEAGGTKICLSLSPGIDG